MKFFLDSANLEEIEQVYRRGLVSGITTNPTLLRQENSQDVIGYLKKVVRFLNDRSWQIPLSVQVMTRDPKQMLEQANIIIDSLQYPQLVIKIPCGWDELEIIHRLSQKGTQVNCTACITLVQAKIAAEAGASYISLFYGKMGDAGLDAVTVVEQVAREFNLSPESPQLIVASIRKIYDIHEIISRGAHIISLPYKFMAPLCQHTKTDEAVESFSQNFLPLNDIQ